MSFVQTCGPAGRHCKGCVVCVVFSTQTAFLLDISKELMSNDPLQRPMLLEVLNCMVAFKSPLSEPRPQMRRWVCRIYFLSVHKKVVQRCIASHATTVSDNISPLPVLRNQRASICSSMPAGVLVDVQKGYASVMTGVGKWCSATTESLREGFDKTDVNQKPSGSLLRS